MGLKSLQGLNFLVGRNGNQEEGWRVGRGLETFTRDDLILAPELRKDQENERRRDVYTSRVSGLVPPTPSVSDKGLINTPNSLSPGKDHPHLTFPEESRDVLRLNGRLLRGN